MTQQSIYQITMDVLNAHETGRITPPSGPQHLVICFDYPGTFIVVHTFDAVLSLSSFEMQLINTLMAADIEL